MLEFYFPFILNLNTNKINLIGNYAILNKLYINTQAMVGMTIL